MEAERRIAKIYGDSTKRYHIIRLGHVYGDEQWLSRYILENAADNRFRLPYDGNRSSNAIHVDDVTRALVGLIRDPCASGIYNLTPTPQQSWRDLFDWHTDACGLTRVHSMEEGQAKSLHNTFVLESRNSPLKKGLVVFGNLKQGFSLEWLLGSNDFKHLGNVVLSFLPARIERRMKAISAMRIVRNEIAMLRTPSPSGSFLFSDAMPGPYLDIPTSLVGHDVEAAERRRRLLEYYRTCILGSGW
jgi:hypothetical protein